jgi:hypothetical protein
LRKRRGNCHGYQSIRTTVSQPALAIHAALASCTKAIIDRARRRGAFALAPRFPVSSALILRDEANGGAEIF